MISVDVSKTFASIEARVANASKSVNRALKVSAMEMTDYIKGSLTAHKSRGREYRRRTVRHIASSPGNPPNSDTGFLAFSTTFTKQIKNNTIFVIVGAKYAKALEFGSRRRGLKPRPFVTPARQALGYKIYQRIQKAINDAT